MATADLARSALRGSEERPGVPRPSRWPAARAARQSRASFSGVRSLETPDSARARLGRPPAMLLRAMVRRQTREASRAALRRCQRPRDAHARPDSRCLASIAP